jgi:hypothetical protein
MSTSDVLRDLPAWLEHVSLVTDTSVLDLRRAAVEGIYEAEIPYEDVVAAAHGVFYGDSHEVIVRAIAEADPTFVAGDKDELVFTLAAACTKVLLNDEQTSSIAGLLVGSASFLGLSPRVDGLAQVASNVMAEASAGIRRRLDPKDTPAAIRQFLREAGVQTDPGTADAARDKATAALARRFEDVVVTLNVRLAAMDEEIDALWWARSNVSSSTGKKWDDIAPLERAVIAAHEATEILSSYPATAGFLRVVENVVGETDGRTATPTEIALAAAQAGFRTPERRHPLLPLTSSASIATELAESPDAIPGMIRSRLGLAETVSLNIAEVPEQLLREISLIELLA